ncbi:LOW QUALITY PROTEIN: trichohyalin-like [Seriola aureovittata]|uniref:LOW QUALITY PROTEIN: trichohyalin-like n=1 Tax=Seriola aureovittata TaxID=2871759 RepID=UPI0024BEE6F1|nr:LOW QUALITY PROTEIN: trichohyalin-like [Seriola aureovittata]
MKFPVDLLADVGQAELERSAHNYMNNLLYSSPDSPEHLTFSDSTQVTIDISSVGFIPLYGSSDRQKILALFSPSDPLTAVALYLLDRWWTVDDILKTTDAARDGAMEVETVGERLVLYILNRVIYRAKEMSSDELPFLCHGERDYAKILWSNGEAVGFYSVKPSGSLCNSYSTRSYQLPVMDSMYVRKCQRGKGFGLQMLEDFVLSFKEDCLGLRYPITKSMYKVCEKYLCQYPGDTDLLWEVESVGALNQRTNIASRIQTMALSAVSKSLSLTEESLEITEVTEKRLERQALTRQIKEAESMECTVEIVEEVTVLRVTRVSEAEDVPVAVGGRSSGSKQRNITEKTPEDKSEKVIRIEDIEAETPREQQGKKVHDVPELEQTEGMFSVAAEQQGEDVVDTVPEDEDKPATVLDLEEADVIATPMTEKPQADDATQDLKNDSQITVENMASEIEEECQEEDVEVLASSEELIEEHTEAETLEKVGKERTEMKVSDEKSEERIARHDLSLSTHTTSEDIEAEKAVVKVTKGVRNETHRRRSQQHSKPLEAVTEETTAQEGGKILRRRTVSSAPTPKRKYTRHSRKICKELEKEIDDVAGENEGSTTGVVEELAVAERKEQEEVTSTEEDIVTVGDLSEDKNQHQEDERLTDEEETKNPEEPGLEDSSAERPNTAETALQKENEDEKVTEQKDAEVEASLIQDKQEVSDEEIEEPPVVQRRAVRGRPRKQRTTRHNQEEEQTHEAGLSAGGSAEERDGQQMEERHRVEKEETVDNIEEIFCDSVVIEATIPKAEEAAEDVLALTEMNTEESKEVQEEEKTEEETDIVSAMEADKEEEADGVSGSGTVIPDEVQEEAGVLGAEEPQDREAGSEIPKLQKASVILVDLKTNWHHLSVTEAEEKTFDGECAAPEMEQTELIAAKEQTPDPEMLMLEEEDGGNQGNITEESVDVAAEVETVRKEELEENIEEAPVTETKVLRSGRKTTEASCKSRGRSNQQQKEDNIGEDTIEKEVDETNTGNFEVEGEMGAVAKDAVTVTVPVEEICADTDVQDTGVEEEKVVKEAAVEKTNEERAEQTEEVAAKVTEEAASEREGIVESEMDVQEGKAVEEEGENVGENQSEVTSKTFAEGEAPEEGGIVVEKKEVVTVEVEEGVSEKGTLSMTEEEENTVGVPAAADDLVQGETDPPLAKPDTDSALLTPSEEEAKPSTGDQQSKEKTSLLSDLQRVTVVLVDLKKVHHEVQEESAAVEEGVLLEKADAEAEEEQRGGTMKEEETVAEEHVPGSPLQLEKVVMDEEGLEENVKDVVTIQEDTSVGSVEETEAKNVDEEEEEELKVTEMRKRRSRKQAAKVTPRHRSGRSRQRQEEEEVASEIGEEEPVIQVRVLRGGRKSIPVAQRFTTTSTQKQLQEEEKEEGEGIKGSTGVQEGEAEEEEESIEKQRTTQQVENIGPEMGVEKADTMAEEAVAQPDAPEEGQVENTEAPVAQIAETAAGENAQKTLLVAKDDEAKGVSEEEEASVSETRILRGGEKAVRATPRGKATKRQDDEQEVEAARGKSTEEGESAVETRVLRKGRRSAPATPRYRSKRARTQCRQRKRQKKSTPAEETEGEDSEADESENNSDEKIEEKDDEGVQKEDTEPEVPEESFAEQEEQSADGQAEASAGASHRETPTTNKGNITDEEEAPAVEPTGLRSGGKSAVRVQVQSADEPAETRVLRKGRRSAPATPRHRSKRARTQCQQEEVTSPAEEAEGEEEEAGEKSPEERGEKAEEEGKCIETEVEKKKGLEEEDIESAAGGGSVVGDAEKTDTLTEETAVLKKEDRRVTAVDETGTDTVHFSSAEVAGADSAEEEETTVIEKSTAATEVGSDTTTAEEEALVEGPVVTRALRSKAKASNATPSRGSRRQKDQGGVESQQQGEETLEDVDPLTDDTAENRELNIKEQADMKETSSTGEEAKPPAEDTAENQAKEKAEPIYSRELEPAAEEPAAEDMESEEDSSSDESKEDQTVDSVVEVRNLRRMKTANKEEDKAEEIQLPKRRSIRIRPIVDYRENEEEEEGGEAEAATVREVEVEVESDEDDDNKKAECSADEQIEKLEEDDKNENLGKDTGAIERTSEKGDILNLELDTDEEAETAVLNQEDEDDEQDISEEEVEPIVISKRVLRGRSVPSVIITPQAKPRRRRVKVQKGEESDKEKSHESAQERRPRKRKCTEVTPTRKSKRHSRV